VETEGHFGLAAVEVVGENREHGLAYEPTPVESFRRMLARLPIRAEEFVFVDFGSGKGRALLLASALPFRRVVGVEICRELHEVARSNIARLGRQDRVETVWMDAARFPIPEVPAVFYFFNPFKEAVLRQVLANIERSLSACPREVYLIFYAPVSRDSPWDRRPILRQSELLREVCAERDFSIYAATRPR
jgi:predicted RNA methylase